jgi:hypothetical protein
MIQYLGIPVPTKPLFPTFALFAENIVMSKILLAGATGYVGGTVLSQLLVNTASSIKDLTFGLLVRDNAQAIKLEKACYTAHHDL